MFKCVKRWSAWSCRYSECTLNLIGRQYRFVFSGDSFLFFYSNFGILCIATLHGNIVFTFSVDECLQRWRTFARRNPLDRVGLHRNFEYSNLESVRVALIPRLQSTIVDSQHAGSFPRTRSRHCLQIVNYNGEKSLVFTSFHTGRGNFTAFHNLLAAWDLPNLIFHFLTPFSRRISPFLSVVPWRLKERQFVLLPSPQSIRILDRSGLCQRDSQLAYQSFLITDSTVGTVYGESFFEEKRTALTSSNQLLTNVLEFKFYSLRCQVTVGGGVLD